MLGHCTELGPQAHLLRTFNLISPNSLKLEIEKWIRLYTKPGKMGKHALLLAELEGTLEGGCSQGGEWNTPGLADWWFPAGPGRDAVTVCRQCYRF